MTLMMMRVMLSRKVRGGGAMGPWMTAHKGGEDYRWVVGGASTADKCRRRTPPILGPGLNKGSGRGGYRAP